MNGGGVSGSAGYTDSETGLGLTANINGNGLSTSAQVNGINMATNGPDGFNFDEMNWAEQNINLAQDRGNTLQENRQLRDDGVTNPDSMSQAERNQRLADINRRNEDSQLTADGTRTEEEIANMTPEQREAALDRINGEVTVNDIPGIILGGVGTAFGAAIAFVGLGGGKPIPIPTTGNARVVEVARKREGEEGDGNSSTKNTTDLLNKISNGDSSVLENARIFTNENGETVYELPDGGILYRDDVLDAQYKAKLTPDERVEFDRILDELKAAERGVTVAVDNNIQLDPKSNQRLENAKKTLAEFAKKVGKVYFQVTGVGDMSTSISDGNERVINRVEEGALGDPNTNRLPPNKLAQIDDSIIKLNDKLTKLGIELGDVGKGYSEKAFEDLDAGGKADKIKKDLDALTKQKTDLEAQRDALKKGTAERLKYETAIKDLDILSGRIKFQDVLLRSTPLEIQRDALDNIKPESLLGPGRIVLDPADLKTMLTSGYYTQNPEKMGAIMANIQNEISQKNPFPITQLKEALGTKPETYRIITDPKTIKDIFTSGTFANDSQSAICYSFVNYVMQKANGITDASFSKWYLDNVKAGAIGVGTHNGHKGVFQGTGDVNPKTFGDGQNVNGVNYGTFKEPLRIDHEDKPAVNRAVTQLNNSSAQTAILHIDTGSGGEGDHFITIIRNPEAGTWETVDHTGTGWSRGQNPFDPTKDYLKNIRRITYVE